MRNFRLDNNPVYVKFIYFLRDLSVLIENCIPPPDQNLVHNSIIKVKSVFLTLFPQGNTPIIPFFSATSQFAVRQKRVVLTYA